MKDNIIKNIRWLPLIWILAFLLPFLTLSLLRWPRWAYYLVALFSTVSFSWYYFNNTGFRLGHSLKHGWALGLIFAVFFGLGFLSFTSASNPEIQKYILNPKTASFFIMSILYGLFSATLITTLPFIIIWRAIGENARGTIKKSLVTGVAIVAIGVTALLNTLGMPHSSSRDFKTEYAKVLLSGVPTIVSGNLMAAPIASLFLQISEAADQSSQQEDMEKLHTTSPTSGGMN